MRALHQCVVLVFVLVCSPSIATAQLTPPSFTVDFALWPAELGWGVGGTLHLTFIRMPTGTTLEIYAQRVSGTSTPFLPFHARDINDIWNGGSLGFSVDPRRGLRDDWWGHTFAYRVRLSDTHGRSTGPWSAPVTYTFPSKPGTAPQQPAPADRPLCSHWNAPWYHHLTTVDHIRYCLASERVDINQRDLDGRTLLHRIAVDIAATLDGVQYEYPDACCRTAEGGWRAGNNRKTRRAMVKELLRWNTLDLDAVDHTGKTALRYAVRKTKGWKLVRHLLDAGAAVTLTDNDTAQVKQHGIPAINTVHQRFADPFAGDVTIGDLAECTTADCLLGKIVKDPE